MKLLLTFILIAMNLSFASKRMDRPVQYKTYFGQCPTKIVGKLTLELVKTYEKERSLYSIKEKILAEKLKDKFFLSEYKVSKDPISQVLRFKYDCPTPLLKVQIYKENGEEFYSAILGDNGVLLDPTYEVLLRGEKILRGKLPSMAMPLSYLDSDLQKDVTRLVSKMDRDLKKKISEVIVSDKGELTMILSVQKRPSSVFLGEDYWSTKMVKLEKLVNHMQSKKKVPKVINMTDAKKVVVRF